MFAIRGSIFAIRYPAGNLNDMRTTLKLIKKKTKGNKRQMKNKNQTKFELQPKSNQKNIKFKSKEN